jgi:hypothetical protein
MVENHLIDNYVRWLETLGPHGVHRLAPFVSKDVRCRTPDAEGLGVPSVAAVFGLIFEHGVQVKTKVLDRMAGSDGHTVYLRWDRIVTTKDGKFSAFSGVTELMISHDDKIVSIIDYWDCAPETIGKQSWWRQMFG